MARVRHRIPIGAALAVLLALTLIGASGSSALRRHAPVRLAHIFVIMLENHSQPSVIGDPSAPYITKLARTYGRAANYYGVTHTSQPNYIAATSGSNWWVNDDSPNHRYAHTNLVDQLEAHHLTWAAYMETMPSPGYLGSLYPPGVGLYVNRHNPFILYADIRSRPGRRAHIKPYAQFARDMGRRNVPSFVWISPNLCHDMHGGVTVTVKGVKIDGAPCPFGYHNAADEALKRKGNAFVEKAVKTIMASRAWKKPSAIFILTDETTVSGNAAADGYLNATACCDSPVLPAGTQLLTGTTWPGGPLGGGSAVAVVVANRGKRHYVSNASFNHYSLLATIEQNWGLGYLGYASDRARVPTLRVFLTR